MTARITPHQAQEVERLRGLGRTDRQIERAVGLSYGLLGRPYVVDRETAEGKAKRLADLADWNRRYSSFERARHAEIREASKMTQRRRALGWRPEGDCVTSKPNENPLRPVPARQQGDRA